MRDAPVGQRLPVDEFAIEGLLAHDVDGQVFVHLYHTLVLLGNQAVLRHVLPQQFPGLRQTPVVILPSFFF